YNGSEPEKFADEKVEESHNGYKQMEERYKGLVGTRIVLLGSSPYDEDVVIPDNKPLKNKNKAMQRIVDFQRASATANKWEFLDFNEPMTAISKRVQQGDPSFTLSGNDRVHPDLDGHMVMAYLLLKAQGLSGQNVAKTETNTPNQKLKTALNSHLSDSVQTGTGWSFDYHAKALPYQVDTVARGWGSKKSAFDALALVPFMEGMN